jgi:hypothetical protein
MAAAPAPVNPLAGPERRRHVTQMAVKDKEREERLAAALRDNLRRRKAQLRKPSEEPPKEARQD